ncbi:MAG: TetR/AcrR family transcriptional regulator, cholesterol catabolism regulator [Chloroflexota bacterium]|jgi:AcrR family transcriptional regulator|nr:TetR/AcrR family transcriptional regulator, cholesterol catabolism regulator [Chloroflexota bacterium]
MVETRRQQIENRASALFRERGYAATSVRDIARAMDMQGASLYAHVASKEDVLWSIVTRAADRFDAAVAPIAGNTATPATDRLSAMIRAHIQVVTDDLGNATSFLHEWRFLSAERRSAIAARRDAYEQRFRDVIAQGIDAGELTPAADTNLTATLILSALNGAATWYRPDGVMTPDQIASRFSTVFLDGLRRPTAAGRILR